MRSLFLASIIFLQLLSASVSIAQSRDFRIFGQITTVENQELTGYITWAKNKMFWIDFFEASKTENPYARYFSINDGLRFQNNGNISCFPPSHDFCCRFGDIRTIELNAYNRIELQIKDGHIIQLEKGSSSDIGTSVRIQNGQENINVEWDKISKVEFMASERTGNDSFNIPITGIVKTNQGLYKGVITWNNENRTIDNAVNGKSVSGEVSVEFRHIRKIVKERNTFRIVLNDGHETVIRGNGDLNAINRGVLVNMPNIGSVFIPWEKFEYLEMIGSDEIHLLSYSDFKIPERINGEVLTRNGEKVKGILAYGLDASMNIEVLEGRNDNIFYKIPFRYIQSIEPKNYKYSFITLYNGSQVSLGDTPDVNHENSGTIVLGNHEIPTYIPWSEVKNIKIQVPAEK